MAAQDGLSFEGTFNSPTTGLFKDNTTHDIGADDSRALVTAIKESYLNRIDDVIDEDSMASDSAVKVPTQQSVKAYVDSQVGASGTTIPYGETSGTNTYAIAASPAVASYADGDLYLIYVSDTSTGPSTLNFNAVGAKDAFITPEHQIGDGDLVAGRFYLFTYDDALDGATGGFVMVNGHTENITNYDASGGAVPSAIGSGPSGAIRNGDHFKVSVAGTVGGVVLTAGDVLISTADAPTLITQYAVLSGVDALTTKLALKANIASPTFTGTPGAPTAAPGTNTTQIATTAFVQSALGTVDASTTAKGVVEIPTLAQVVACTDTGETGALLAVQPSHLGQTFSEDGSGTLATVQAHHNGLIKFSSATPINYQLDPLLEDTKITFINYGAGAVTFTPGSGVTITGNTVLQGSIGNDYPGVLVVYDALNSPRVISSSGIGVQDKWVGAKDMIPSATAGCSALTPVEIATSLLNIQVLDFDQTTEESAHFNFPLPRKFSFTFTYKVYWTAAAGSAAQTVQWAINTMSYSNDDPLTGTFGSSEAVSDALIATGDLHITDVSNPISVSGTPGQEDFIAFRIRRMTGSDNLAGDARLLGVMLRMQAIAAIDG